MKKLMIPFALALGVGLLTSAGSISNDTTTGKGIFLQYKCNMCHTIESQGVTRIGKPPAGKQPPDLSGVGLQHNADWISKWLLKEEELDGKKHIKKFTGPEDQLKTLSTWLGSLKKKTT